MMIIGLVGKDQKGFSYEGNDYEAEDLLTHMRNLNHYYPPPQQQLLDILKVDIEGSEYDAFDDIKIGNIIFDLYLL